MALDKPMMLALIATVLFVVLNYTVTYDLTHKLLGGVVGQPTVAEYGPGSSLGNYGFLVHALVFGAATYFIFKKQLK